MQKLQKLLYSLRELDTLFLPHNSGAKMYLKKLETPNTLYKLGD